jgi:acyl-CoA synthetase (AMP-forming)/AMP-acid ligase II
MTMAQKSIQSHTGISLSIFKSFVCSMPRYRKMWSTAEGIQDFLLNTIKAKKGDRVILLLEENLEFACCILGCFLAGVIAVYQDLSIEPET